MLTVILATHNGERTLPAVLEGYRRLVEPAGGWKLHVADNASTDSTPALLAHYARLLPLTLSQVAAPGKNRALNAVLDKRAGDLVVFTDDDAVPAPQWLQELRAAADGHPEFDIFGGAIVPRWESTPQPWLLEWVPHDITYTLTTPGRHDGPMSAAEVWGPNMAVRARLFDAGHRFEEFIGPQAGRSSYAMGSETEFTLRMEQLGHRARFVSGAVVEHMVRAFQMQESWILRRAVRYGRCVYRRERQRADPLPSTFLGVPRWKLRRLFTEALSLAAARLSGNERKAFHEAWTLRFDWGYLSEAWRGE